MQRKSFDDADRRNPHFTPSKCDYNSYGNRGVDTKVDTVRGEANRVETPFKNGKVINTKKDEPEKPACKLGLVYCDRRRHQCAFQLGL
jgi:hypothetical protein